MGSVFGGGRSTCPKTVVLSSRTLPRGEEALPLAPPPAAEGPGCCCCWLGLAWRKKRSISVVAGCLRAGGVGRDAAGQTILTLTYTGTTACLEQTGLSALARP